MCGISGFYDPGLSSDQSRPLLEKMVAQTLHRGPDNFGYHIDEPIALGHNRLSIIDLDDSANQPFEYHGVWLVFNGEVYNYLELKEELKQHGYLFRTQSDTEVVAAAWKAWGENCVSRFVGMWAFAIWDLEQKLLFCSRDRFGIKPFYYIHSGNRFYFGSEYKNLKVCPIFQGKVNLNQVARGLQLGWVTWHDETYFADIHSLPPAHNLVFQGGNVKILNYWQLQNVEKLSLTFEEKTELFQNAFFDSISLHLRSDVEVGGCLSGGLDSSAIAAVIGERYPQQTFRTFTIYYEGKDTVDERPFASTLAEKYPNIQSYYYQPSDKEIEEHFDSIIRSSDVPIAGSSPISQYFVMKFAASQKIRVLLDGQGSDEYLAGYMHSFYRFFAGLFNSLNWKTLSGELRAYDKVHNPGLKQWQNIFAKSALASIFNEQTLYAQEYRRNFPVLLQNPPINPPFHLSTNFSGRLDQFLSVLISASMLPTLLHYEDRNSMAFSIESRVPFLDHRLVELGFRLSDTDKINNGQTKYILRESLRNYLPKKIYYRTDKKGFVTPGEVKWLRGPLREHVVVSQQLKELLDYKKTEIIFKDYLHGSNRYAKLVWRLVTLGKWLEN